MQIPLIKFFASTLGLGGTKASPYPLSFASDLNNPENLEHPVLYKVDMKPPGWFHIIGNKTCGLENVFSVSYDKEMKEKGLLFPKARSRDKPVAIIDGKITGLNKSFEVYEIDGEYIVSYPLSPLLEIPKHTYVASNYLLTVQKDLEKIPKPIEDDIREINFRNRGAKLILGFNEDDTYYAYKPDLKESDLRKIVDPNKPPHEFIDNKWIDNRLYKNIRGVYLPEIKRALMSQWVAIYGSEDLYCDYSESPQDIGGVALHEMGHAFDYLQPFMFSETNAFIKAYDSDMKAFSENRAKLEEKYGKDKINFWCSALRNEQETFAQLFCGLLDGLDKESKEILLTIMPSCAKHIKEIFSWYRVYL